MKTRSLLLALAGLVVAGIIVWLSESCTSHAYATEASEEQPAPAPEDAESFPEWMLVDKNADYNLQEMRSELLPRFAVRQYRDMISGSTMDYNLFSPRNIVDGEKYPLIVFLADATTVGTDVTRPVLQGYGALVWASNRWQTQHPCFVLVPQFNGVAANDDCSVTAEADVASRLIRQIISSHTIDSNRIYLAGQGSGGIVATYLATKYPDKFAALMCVDSHWPEDKIAALDGQNIIFVTAGSKGRSAETARDLAARFPSASCKWGGNFDEESCEEVAAELLGKGKNVNLITLADGTPLPESGCGSERLYAFDYPFRIAALRQWVFSRRSR